MDKLIFDSGSGEERATTFDSHSAKALNDLKVLEIVRNQCGAGALDASRDRPFLHSSNRRRAVLLR